MRIFVASLTPEERADLRPLRAEVDRILAEESSAAPELHDYAWECAICERDAAAADRALAAMPAEGFRGYLGSIRPREFYVGYTARMFNGLEAARPALVAARAILEKHLRERPDAALSWSLLGRTRAMLGEKEQAIEACQHACELWPLWKEPLWGLKALRGLAATYACLGEKDLALLQLSSHAGQPEFVNYGDLKLDPAWDPLRGDPRFEKIVASLAPK